MNQRVYMVTNRFKKIIGDTLEGSSPVGRIVTMFIVGLILLNVCAVVVESVPSIGIVYGRLFYAFEVFSISIFTFEYILRLWSAGVDGKPFARVKFLLRPLSIIDALAILPFFLPVLIAMDLRVLRVLRLLRVLRVAKIARYSPAIRALGTVLKEKMPELAVTGLVAVMLLTLSASMMYHFEKEAQPEAFSSIPHAMWWAVATLTTVGYGDVTPITVGGRIFGSIVAFMGIGLVALPAGILGSGFITYLDKIKKESKPEKVLCKKCGTVAENDYPDAA